MMQDRSSSLDKPNTQHSLSDIEFIRSELYKIYSATTNLQDERLIQKSKELEEILKQFYRTWSK